MARVFFMFKGLPGCGKSTVARDIMDHRNCDPTVIVERDIIREELGFLGKPFSKENEALVTERQEKDLSYHMALGESDVISSDTNFNPKCLALYEKLCKEYGYVLQVIDMSDVPIETCIARDAERTGPKHVGEKVIRDMARRYHIGPYKEETVPPVPVTDPLDGYDRTRPACIIVDLDGTIAKAVNRSPYDEANVYQDEVRWNVVDAIKGLYQRIEEFSDIEICFLSGRTDACYDDTFLWIMEKASFDSDVYKMSLSMRKKGDCRRDSIVKNEIFDAKIRGKYNVLAAFDDRDQVIRECWLPKGITVFNVGLGGKF